jgi:antitoxin component of MazEF toxin-antitoxin module
MILLGKGGGGMDIAITKLGKGSRVVIPSRLRKAIGLNLGDDVLLGLEGDKITITPRKGALEDVQRMIRKKTKGRSLVDELLAERRQEAQHE